MDEDSHVDVKLNRASTVAVVVCLVVLALAPLVYWRILEESHSFREPVHIYSSDAYDSLYDSETISKVWNTTRDLPQVFDFSRYGNYFVLISLHAYRVGVIGYSEWFVVASTLQPEDGVIHELVVRFSANASDFGDITFVKSYESAHSFNLTSHDDGHKAITDFMDQHESFRWIGYPIGPSSVYFPFLLFFQYPSDFGGTIILNLNTGKILIAASGIWMGSGDLVCPEFISRLGKTY